MLQLKDTANFRFYCANMIYQDYRWYKLLFWFYPGTQNTTLFEASTVLHLLVPKSWSGHYSCLATELPKWLCGHARKMLLGNKAAETNRSASWSSCFTFHFYDIINKLPRTFFRPFSDFLPILIRFPTFFRPFWPTITFPTFFRLLRLTWKPCLCIL